MNALEKQMYEILKKLRDESGVVGVKAEFEAEGTRLDELLRLVEIVRKSNLKLGIKIGGCEAMKDLMECKQIGVDYIIAPMVETPYALQKFIQAKNKVFLNEEKKDTIFLINVETKQTFENIKQIINFTKKNKNELDGLVFGRTDYTLSCNYDKIEVNSEKVTNDIKIVSKLCKENDLQLVVGGGVSIDAIPCLNQISQIHLNRFETRKIIFSKESLNIKSLKDTMLNAVRFELSWLRNKKNYYENIFKEDDSRIKILSDRWGV